MTTALTTIAPKLSKLVALLSSNKDGEVIATVRAIGRTLKQAGADFHDLAAAIARTEPRDAIELLTWGDIPSSERAAWLARIAVSTRLSPWERDFASSIMAQTKFRPWARLSEKQIAVLDRALFKFSMGARR